MNVTAGTASTAELSVEFDSQRHEWRHVEQHARMNADAMFSVEVGRANELRLIPKCDLARSLLAMWMHGTREARVGCALSGAPGDGTYGRDVQAMDITFVSRPMLSQGDDPYYTGMALKPEEYEAARKAVDALRSEPAVPVKKPRRGKR